MCRLTFIRFNIFNSFEEKYYEQTIVAENFDKTIKEEEKAENRVAILETELLNAQKALEKVRNECNICQEQYDDIERRESVLYCGHRSCFKCLTSLPNKICPICRKEFTVEQIIKLF